MLVSPIGLNYSYAKTNIRDSKAQKNAALCHDGNSFKALNAETLAVQRGVKFGVNFKGTQDKGRKAMEDLEAKMEALKIEAPGNFVNEFMVFNPQKIDSLYTYLEDVGEEYTHFTSEAEKAKIKANPKSASDITPRFIDRLVAKYPEDRGISWWNLANLEYFNLFEPAGYTVYDEDMNDDSSLAMSCKDFMPDRIDACDRILNAIAMHRKGNTGDVFPENFIGFGLLRTEDGPISATKLKEVLRLIEETDLPLEEIANKARYVNPKRLGVKAENDILRPQ